jgi:hypothetical protein
MSTKFRNVKCDFSTLVIFPEITKIWSFFARSKIIFMPKPTRAEVPNGIFWPATRRWGSAQWLMGISGGWEKFGDLGGCGVVDKRIQNIGVFEI